MAKLPIRNKSEDNPYTLNFDEYKKVYTVEFVDNKRKFHKIEISEKVYRAFDKFELEDVSQEHKYRSHIEHSDLCEESLYSRSSVKPLSIEEEIENKLINEELISAINRLSDAQKRRIKMYYFDGLTQQEIADKEHTSIRAIQYTLNDALKKLKEILKK